MDDKCPICGAKATDKRTSTKCARDGERPVPVEVTTYRCGSFHKIVGHEREVYFTESELCTADSWRKELQAQLASRDAELAELGEKLAEAGRREATARMLLEVLEHCTYNDDRCLECNEQYPGHTNDCPIATWLYGPVEPPIPGTAGKEGE